MSFLQIYDLKVNLQNQDKENIQTAENQVVVKIHQRPFGLLPNGRC